VIRAGALHGDKCLLSSFLCICSLLLGHRGGPVLIINSHATGGANDGKWASLRRAEIFKGVFPLKGDIGG